MPPEEVDAERVVSTPAPPQTARPATLKERFGTQWVVWIGGLALALGAIFLVRYTVGLAIVIGLERVRLRTPEMEILRARQSMLPARLKPTLPNFNTRWRIALRRSSMITSLITAFVLRMIAATAYAAVKLIVESARSPLAFVDHYDGRETGSMVGSTPGSRR